MTSFLSELNKRNLIHDVSNFEELEKHLESSPTTFYCGFDPTADSLTAGHLVALLMMRRFQQRGHKPIALVGSATGMIGDPGGRSDERNLLTKEQVEHNAQCLEKQIGRIVEASGSSGFKLVKNHDWLGNITLIDFLRDVGKFFSVNNMIAKDSVKIRIESREQGISFTEFSYQILQAYDFYFLNKTYNCTLQIGGSDQWGNITAGVDFIRKKKENEAASVFAVTFPLVMTSTGQKMGKSAKGALWLDAKRTSPYQFYQYWYNTADADIKRYIEMLMDISDEEMSGIENDIIAHPEARSAQQKLAEYLTSLVHGSTELSNAKRASEVLFGGSIENIDSTTLLDIFSDVPSTTITRDQIGSGLGLSDMLAAGGVAQSKSAARRLIEGGGLYVNNVRAGDPSEIISIDRFVDGKVLVIRSGKRNYHLILVS